MDNVYHTPQADLEDGTTKNLEFYGVSPLKFTVLFFSTLGLYQIYWNYKNWSNLKTKQHLKIWPLARSIFSIFFINSLLKRVDDSLTESNTGHSWKPSLIANIYILLYVVGNVCDRLAEEGIGAPITLFVSILVLPVVWFYLRKAQVAINLAVNDPLGELNARFTAANIVWIVLGVIFWLLAIVGLMDGVGIINLDS